MTVLECINSSENSGTIKVYDDRKKIYLNNQNALHKEVKRVTYHRGWGFKQVNAVIHV